MNKYGVPCGDKLNGACALPRKKLQIGKNFTKGGSGWLQFSYSYRNSLDFPPLSFIITYANARLHCSYILICPQGDGKRGGARVEKNEWVLCPRCGNKTRTMVRTDTVLKNFPLYCPKCKQETLVNVQKLNTSVIIEPDALT